MYNLRHLAPGVLIASVACTVVIGNPENNFNRAAEDGVVQTYV
jgi:hypothetical protein